MPPNKKTDLPPIKGEPIKPFMFFADVWKREDLNEVRMKAYKHMEAAGQLQIVSIIYSKANGKVVVEYRSSMPHEWLLDDLRNWVKEQEKPPEQIAMV